MTDLPTLRLTGSPAARGQTHGRLAATRVRRSIDAYREVFAHLAGWSWSEVLEAARPYEDVIAAHHPTILDEMHGIARGADVTFADVLAINARTEVMFAAKARTAQRTTGRGECSAVAVLPGRTASGRTILAQNWDWLPHCAETVVMLEVEQDDAPDYVTVVEAGLLAKTGVNARGVAVTTNALVTTDDRGEPGVPYHVLLRALMDAPSLSQALASLQGAPRSSSANFLLADRDGLAIDVEVAPGDFSRVFLIQPTDGTLVHTNHFIAPRFDGVDVSLWAMPDSPLRLQRLEALIADAGCDIDRDQVAGWLGDHANHPAGVCCHPDRSLPALDQDATVVSVIIEPQGPTLWVAAGPPCRTPYVEHDLGVVFAGRAPDDGTSHPDGT